jgi:2-keto-4-pentenoate hydratase
MRDRASRKSRALKDKAAAAAQWLCAEHEARRRFVPLPAGFSPATPDAAYAIQDAFVAMRAKKLGGLSGYKIALSTPAMQQFVGVDSPQAGVILESRVLRTPARIRCADYVNLIVEFEIAVEAAEDLPAADAPFTRERVMQSVGAVMAAIELADDRNADYAALRASPLDLIADNGWNEGVVLGPRVQDWRAIDLAAARGVAKINGSTVGEGRGADALGHPFEALAWMCNHLAGLGRGLLRGEFLITGSLVTTKAVKPGDLVEFAVGGLGPVELRVE